ncbi:general secretion pathway protein GspK [Noviherbaspirillum denitrificans]|uniref:Type II secretion system protein K n=2 Tax=Noviherbaspirillum denitrificans TaxID=1968433 RepID=A0A254TJA6_9BURK|nr:type II secretion system minor pseudopilin GspK [Noviherbaspirillum denitrificans]OWW22711.1 general secretion pathway protein GspK [Noviherbaspirillum denitrificans]
MKRRIHRQRGVAVITALLLTTLAITIVASLFWQQQVQVRSIENQRLQLQKQWILRGALDWARLILGEDKRIGNRYGDIDHLGEPWAVPLAETRLDQYVEKDRAGDVPDAALSGGITDAQARYNLRNLCSNGVINDQEVARFGKLLTLLGINPALSRATAVLMQSTQPKTPSPGGAPAAKADSAPLPMELLHVDDLLAVPGFTPELLEKVRNYVVVLPSDVTKINVNTAPAEVIAAKVDTLSLAEASSLVAARQSRPFQSLNDLPLSAGLNRDGLDVKTSYFFVNGNVRLNRAGMEMQALIKRDQARQTVLWIREY